MPAAINQILSKERPWSRSPSHFLRKRMRSYTLKEKAKLTAGAVTALVIVAWLVVAALALLSAG